MAKSTRLFRGLPVVDATRPMILTLKQRDASKGFGQMATACAVVRAIKRQEHVEGVVHLSKIFIRRNDHWERYNVPPSLRTEIVVMDRGGDVMGGDFRLTPPSPSMRFGAARAKAKPT